MYLVSVSVYFIIIHKVFYDLINLINQSIYLPLIFPAICVSLFGFIADRFRASRYFQRFRLQYQLFYMSYTPRKKIKMIQLYKNIGYYLNEIN